MVIFFLSYCLLFNKITLNKGNVGTNHLNNRILLFVCNRKVIYYYYITLPSITITITITFGNFQSITITITITGKSGYYYYNYILHITITPSLVRCIFVEKCLLYPIILTGKMQLRKIETWDSERCVNVVKRVGCNKVLLYYTESLFLGFTYQGSSNIGEIYLSFFCFIWELRFSV